MNEGLNVTDGLFARLKAEFDAMTPEQKAARETECEARKREDLDLQHSLKVNQLKDDWNAPRRHVLARGEINRTGEWGTELAKLLDKLNTGFLIALTGNRGAGKTQMAVEAMTHSVNLLRPARYASAVEFFMAIKATYKKDSRESEDDVIQLYRKPRLLVIDEAAKRSETQWENLLLFELLDKRYQDMSDTLLIANQTYQEFVTSIGPSLSSRMEETGGIIECNWKSFR